MMTYTYLRIHLYYYYIKINLKIVQSNHMNNNIIIFLYIILN